MILRYILIDFSLTIANVLAAPGIPNRQLLACVSIRIP